MLLRPLVVFFGLVAVIAANASNWETEWRNHIASLDEYTSRIKRGDFPAEWLQQSTARLKVLKLGPFAREER